MQSSIQNASEEEMFPIAVTKVGTLCQAFRTHICMYLFKAQADKTAYVEC